MSTSSKPNVRLAGFDLIKKIGQGGMGAVYLARQISMDRLVALKILPPRLAAEPEMVRRFLREARVSARLRHPGVVNGIDVGKSDGLYYFAMEYAPGKTLHDMLDSNGPFSEHLIVSIARQLSDALAYSELNGIIHRDIKPDNIIINERGRVKLLDLGLATFASETRPDETGRAIGTPNYLSPEQARGDPKIDSRADIYCLGATLYHLVTGKPLFRGSTREILHAHVSGAARNPLTLRPDFNPDILFVIERMLAKSPDDRYASATDLAADWERIEKKRSPDAATRPAPSASLEPTAVALRRLGVRRRLLDRLSVPSIVVAVSLGCIILLLLYPLSVEKPTGSDETNGDDPSNNDRLKPATGRAITDPLFGGQPSNGFATPSGGLSRTAVPHPTGGTQTAPLLERVAAELDAISPADIPPDYNKIYQALAGFIEAQTPLPDTENQVRRAQSLLLRTIEASVRDAARLSDSADTMARIDLALAAGFILKRADRFLPPDRLALTNRASDWNRTLAASRFERESRRLSARLDELKVAIADGRYADALSLRDSIAGALADSPSVAETLDDWPDWSLQASLLAGWLDWTTKVFDADVGLDARARRTAAAIPAEHPYADRQHLLLGALLHLSLRADWSSAREILARPDCAIDSEPTVGQWLAARIVAESQQLIDDAVLNEINEWRRVARTRPTDALVAWSDLRNRQLSSNVFQALYPELSATAISCARARLTTMTINDRRNLSKSFFTGARTSAAAYADYLATTNAAPERVADMYLRGGRTQDAEKQYRAARRRAEQAKDAAAVTLFDTWLLVAKLARNEISGIDYQASRLLASAQTSPESVALLNELIGLRDDYESINDTHRRDCLLLHSRQLDATALYEFAVNAKRLRRYLREREALEMLLLDYPEAPALLNGDALFALLESRYGQADFAGTLDLAAAIRFFARTQPAIQSLIESKHDAFLDIETTAKRRLTDR